MRTTTAGQTLTLIASGCVSICVPRTADLIRLALRLDAAERA